MKPTKRCLKRKRFFELGVRQKFRRVSEGVVEDDEDAAGSSSSDCNIAVEDRTQNDSFDAAASYSSNDDDLSPSDETLLAPAHENDSKIDFSDGGEFSEPERLVLTSSDESDRDAESSDEEEANDEKELIRVQQLLAEWVTEDNHSESSIDRLLAILKTLKGLENLPKSKKTLMKTDCSKVGVEAMDPGHYYHFGVASGILGALHETYSDLNLIDHLGLMVGVDGVPLAKSSTSCFWPIVAHIPQLKGSKVFVIGLYEGEGKPADPDEFLRKFVDDMVELSNNGLEFDERHFGVSLMAILADTPAKAFVTRTLGHSGYASCYNCDILGMKYGQGATFFPTESGDLRTEQDFRRQSQPEHHVGDITILSEIPRFFFTKSIPYDYLHLILLGICKKILKLFFVQAKKHLGSKLKNKISEFMLSLNADIPSDFARKARDLKYLAYFKGTELRLFLIYLGPIVLDCLQKHKPEYYQHFMKFHVACHILCGAKVTPEWISYAQKLLDNFVANFPSVHGDESVSSNVHALLHVEEDCLRFGSLDEFSTFKYESFYGRMQFNLQTNGKYLQQFVKRAKEKASIVKTKKFVKPKVIAVSKPFHGSHLHPELLGPMYKVLKYKDCNLTNKAPNNCVMLKNDQFFIIDEISRCRSSFRKISLCGRIFRTKEDLFTFPLNSSALDTYKVSNLSTTRVLVSVRAIEAKCVRLQFANGICSVQPIIHTRIRD